MNPLTLLYSVAALAVTSPAIPASPSDSLHVPPLPVLNDSILLGWHLALIHFYDTLLVHPDLQSMAGVTPMLSGGRPEEQERLWRCPLWDGDNPSKTAPQFKQDGLASFPADSVMQAISQTPTLTGAIQSALLTPSEFVAITSGIYQAHCAQQYFHYIAPRNSDKVDDSLRKSLLDSSSILSKNVAFLYSNPQENSSLRLARAEYGVKLWTRYMEEKQKQGPSWYPKDKRIEDEFVHAYALHDFFSLDGILDPKTGQELPVPHNRR